MLAPKPCERPTVSELLALSSVRKRRWKRRIYLMFAEIALTLASICQVGGLHINVWSLNDEMYLTWSLAKPDFSLQRVSKYKSKLFFLHFQLVVCFGCQFLSTLHSSFLPRRTKPDPCTPPKDSWDRDFTLPLSAMQADSGSPEDDAVFLLDPTYPEHSPTFSHR